MCDSVHFAGGLYSTAIDDLGLGKVVLQQSDFAKQSHRFSSTHGCHDKESRVGDAEILRPAGDDGTFMAFAKNAIDIVQCRMKPAYLEVGHLICIFTLA